MGFIYPLSPRLWVLRPSTIFPFLGWVFFRRGSLVGVLAGPGPKVSAVLAQRHPAERIGPHGWRLELERRVDEAEDRPFYGHSGGCRTPASMSHNIGYVAYDYVVVIMGYDFYALLCDKMQEKCLYVVVLNVLQMRLGGGHFVIPPPQNGQLLPPKRP